MKILLACFLHSYGDPSREYSYEYFNFYKTLERMGYEVEFFDYMGEIRTLGRRGMNEKLLAKVVEWQPTLVLFTLSTDQFEPQYIDNLREHTITACFFMDDTWRVEYSNFWARHFDYILTPDLYGEMKYLEMGVRNAIHVPFGFNEQIYYKLDIPKKVDVSFVGAWHPYREWLIEQIRKAGVSVEVAGHRWPKGGIDQKGMVKLFNESRINLNLSNCASWDVRYLASSPRALLNRVRSGKNVEQLKARPFEINGCGGFQLSYYVDGLENYFEINREIAIYTDSDALIEKVLYYLKHEDSRELIAASGYRRAQESHTYIKRFQQIFQRMGLSNA